MSSLPSSPLSPSGVASSSIASMLSDAVKQAVNLAVSSSSPSSSSKNTSASISLHSTTAKLTTTKSPVQSTSHSTSDVYNWSKSMLLAKRTQVRKPCSEKEIVDLVKLANKQGFKLRVVGSGFSYNPIHSVVNEENALLLDLSNMSGLVNIAESTYTFHAGTRLEDAFKILSEHKRMLPCSPGVISYQTIAGAMATGTHGQGLFQSSLADTVVSMRLVLPDASVAVFDERHPAFGAFVTSLGCLGIVTAISVRTIPFELYTCIKRTVGYPELREGFVALNRQVEYCKAWWFPMTDEVHVWQSDRATPEAVEVFNKGDGSLVPLSASSSALNHTVEKLKEHMAKDTKDPEFSGRAFETVQRFKDASHVCGSVYQIWCKGIPVPQINCEIAVPLSALPQALDALHAWYTTTKPGLHYPFILRSAGPSRAWLSPSFEQEVCFIGFLVYLAKDGTAAPGSFEYMRAIQEILAKFGGVPHLGKHFAEDLYDLKKCFPRFEEFNKLRLTLDPQGRFENRSIVKLFSSPSAPSSPFTTSTALIAKL